MKIKEKILIIKGAPLEGNNPLPKFALRKPTTPSTDKSFPVELSEGVGFQARVLPYLMQDKYSRKRIPLRLKCIVLENEYLKAEFLPQYGGRLHSLYDKEKKRDLVMTNTVIQPCNLAIRNAWLSGGIEWNIGNFGHTYTTCDNVFCAKLSDGDGNEFIRIYEFERLKSIFWQVDFHLPNGAHQLYVHVKMVNPFKENTTTYWWSNVAVPDTGKTRVLSSSDKVISFIGNDMRYETLPSLTVLPGVDVSYPGVSPRAFDYFIQPERPDACTWEAAVYEDGCTFFERSTPPLSYKKLFCWGNHRAGKHWQEFLSEDGKGYYAEIQAGIAPSQLHDKRLPARSSYEWTQCFGSVAGDAATLHSDNYSSARSYLNSLICKEISEDDIISLDKKLSELARLAVSEDMIIHTASGFGALESKRMEKDGDGTVPPSMCFPVSTIGDNEYPWLYLIDNGILPPEDPRYFTPTYNVSRKWLPHLESALKRCGGESWYSLLQYGISVYEGGNYENYVTDTYSESDVIRSTDMAEEAWKKSISLTPSYLAYRNLAVLEEQRNNLLLAEEYYDKALLCDGAFDDSSLAAEAFKLLLTNQKYAKLWNIFLSLPDTCKNTDRIKIYAAEAAVKLDELDYLEKFFNEPHHDIREGEVSLTDIWFEYCARKLARERGITNLTSEMLNELISEAIDICPPEKSIDFRMSLDKKIKYRVD